MRKFFIATAVAIAALGGLFLTAGRNLSELTGYFRASADTAVDGVVHTLPREVHDKKLDHDLRRVRQDVIDRQVQLNLSRGHLEQLQGEVTKLAASVERRQRLLTEAYPILKTAVDGHSIAVHFASTDYSLSEFQRHLDDLLSQQDQEERQLAIKRDGLARLEKNSSDAEQALAEMRRAMDTAEQEIAVLKSRREQAELESQTLDLVASAGNAADVVAAPVTQSLTQLRTEVEKAEARNQARRDLAPVSHRAESNPLGRGWTRLESLKAIHDRSQATKANGAVEPPPTSEKANDTILSCESVIQVQSNQ